MRAFLTSFLTALLCVCGLASAQIGEPPAQLRQSLANLNPVATENGFRAGSLQVTLERRGGALYGVSGSVTLNPRGRAAFAQLVGAATGYGTGIAQPIQDFLATRIGELDGQGEVALAVEEFVLSLNVRPGVNPDVTGGAAPYRAVFGLELARVDRFPPAAHTLGPANAAVVVREFSDFQCPFCAQYSARVLPQLKRELLSRGDVRFEFHHLPLVSIHPNALLAAEAAECVTAANRPRDFWGYHDALFARQTAWAGLGDAAPYFARLAREVGLSNRGVAACLSEGRYTRTVQDAASAALELGLNSTPSVFVGPYRVARSDTLQEYDKAIERLEVFGR